MSYHLLILDLDEIPEFDVLFTAIESEVKTNSGITDSPEPTEALASFLNDVRSFFPSLEDDSENSPWAITPTGKASFGGRALSFTVGKSDLLFDVLMEFEELAWRHDLIICDPQEGTFRRPRNE